MKRSFLLLSWRDGPPSGPWPPHSWGLFSTSQTTTYHSR